MFWCHQSLLYLQILLLLHFLFSFWDSCYACVGPDLSPQPWMFFVTSLHPLPSPHLCVCWGGVIFIDLPSSSLILSLAVSSILMSPLKALFVFISSISMICISAQMTHVICPLCKFFIRTFNILYFKFCQSNSYVTSE